MTKIIFMGTPELSATILKGIINDGSYEILGVVTQPDRAVGRKKEIKMSPVKEVALANNLSVYQPEKLSNSPEMTDLMTLGADGIITAAFGQFLPGKLLDSVDFAINVHGSLLPKYRGGAPIQYAIINGDSQTGITIMEMVRKMDAGDMIAKASIPITDADNQKTMFEKLAILGRDLLLKTLPEYLAGSIVTEPQDESKATFSPNITAQEESIDWSKSNRAIFNLIRGLNPSPVAHTIWNGKRFKIYEADLIDGDGTPGQVIAKTKKNLVIATGQGALSLRHVQPFGKQHMSITDFLNGLGQQIKVGDFFGK